MPLQPSEPVGKTWTINDLKLQKLVQVSFGTGIWHVLGLGMNTMNKPNSLSNVHSGATRIQRIEAQTADQICANKSSTKPPKY